MSSHLLPISVVMPTRDRIERLTRSVLSLAAQPRHEDFELIVVDDGSSADVRGALECLNLPFAWQYVWEQNEGFRAARARNTGVLCARGEIIVFLDDDMVVPPDFIQTHLTAHAAYSDVVAIGLRRRLAADIWKSSDDYGRWNEESVDDPREKTFRGGGWQAIGWAFCATCNLSAPRQALIDAGLFDEAFVGWGFEDTELAYRLQSIGLGFHPVLDAIPIHLEDPEHDMTRLADPYRLPDWKLKDYQRNVAYLLGKYSDDPLLNAIVRQETAHRLVACKGGTELDVREEVDEAPARSLFDAFEDDEEARPPLESPFTAVMNAHSDWLARDRLQPPAGEGASLLEELERLNLRVPSAPRRRRVRVPDSVWTALMAPLVVGIGFGILLLLVVSGRYSRVFRRSRA